MLREVPAFAGMTESSAHGTASNALTRLAEDGPLVKTGYARYRINGLHPELVALRLKLGQADLDGIVAREREIKAAEARGRAGRR